MQSPFSFLLSIMNSSVIYYGIVWKSNSIIIVNENKEKYSLKTGSGLMPDFSIRLIYRNLKERGLSDEEIDSRIVIFKKIMV